MGNCVACYSRCACAPCFKYYDPELARAEKQKKDFTYDGKRFKAKVVDVHDGDTITIVFRPYTEKIQLCARMNGYDSPELHPRKNIANRNAEILAAEAAKNALKNKIGEKIVEIECHPFDKYGRLLVTVHYEGININNWMMTEGHGYAYAGGTKAANNLECARCGKKCKTIASRNKHMQTCET